MVEKEYEVSFVEVTKVTGVLCCPSRFLGFRVFINEVFYDYRLVYVKYLKNFRAYGF